jgi:hypothetical protein
MSWIVLFMIIALVDMFALLVWMLRLKEKG